MSFFSTAFSGILGIGVDLVDARRIQGVLLRHPRSFVQRVFTDQEQAYAETKKTPYLSYAKRFAAKEAFAKATGLGIGRALGWKDIEIVSLPSGQPSFALSHRCQNRLRALWDQPVQGLLSLTDEFPYAQAFVILVRAPHQDTRPNLMAGAEDSVS